MKCRGHMREAHARHLKTELIRSIALGLLVPVFLVFLVIGGLQLRYMGQAIQDNLNMLFSQVSSNVDVALNGMNYVMASATLDDEMNRALYEVARSEASAYGKFVARGFLQSWIKRVNASSLSLFDPGAFLLHEGRLYDGSEVTDVPFENKEQWEKLLLLREPVFFPVDETGARKLFSSTDTDYLLQCQGIRRFSSKLSALVFFRIRLSSFWTGLKDAAYKSGALAITDQEGNLLACTDGFDLEKLGMEDGVHQDLYHQSGPLEHANLWLHYQGQVRLLFRLSFFSFNLLFVVFCVMLGIAMVLCTQISHRFSSPIIRLKKQMDIIEKNEKLLPASEAEEILEIQELEGSYIRAQNRIQSLLLSIEKQVEEREAAYYSALQAQIRPHFLFNTLNAIQWKAKLNRDEEVADVLSSLSLFLRHLYQNEEEFHSLKEEMQFLDEYVKVVNVRFSNGILFYHLLPGDLEECLIPKFCLQPLVENSFFHGFVSQKSGMIVLRVSREGDAIQISIADNGAGASGNDPLAETEVEKHRATGIGLSNILGRLRHLYGNACSITIDTKVSKGFHVIVTIPMHREVIHYDKNTDS